MSAAELLDPKLETPAPEAPEEPPAPDEPDEGPGEETPVETPGESDGGDGEEGGGNF